MSVTLNKILTQTKSLFKFFNFLYLLYLYDKLFDFLIYNIRMEEIKVERKYIIYIENMIKQIAPELPEDVNKLQRDYLISNIRRSTMLLARSMQEDKVFQTLDFERQCTFIQIMAEWSFHKEIDLFRSGIPAKYWKIVMQKIWYTMWEVMFACIQNNAPDNVVLSIIERYVTRTYNDAVEELKNSNIITEETEEKAKVQSNIEKMAQKYLEEQKKEKMKRYLKMTFIMLIIGIMVTVIVLNFKIYGVIGILTIMLFYNVFSGERHY